MSGKVALCKSCSKVPCAEQSSFCSVDCRDKWKLLCKVCRQKPRISKHYCGDACRDSLEKYSREGRIRPLCVPHLETGECADGERCFGHHEIPPAWQGCLVLPSQRSHGDRLTKHVEDNFSCNVVSRELSNTSKSNLKVPEFLILNPKEVDVSQVMLGNETERSVVEFALSTIFQIGSSSLISRLVRKVYYVDSFSISESRVVNDIISTRIAPLLSSTSDNADLRCRVIAYPRNLERKLAAAIADTNPQVGATLIRSADANVIINVVRAADQRFYYSVIDLRKLDETVVEQFRQIVNSVTAAAEPDLKVVCRAHYKIAEVFERFSFPIEPTSKAIDIGASPGGWTYYLAERCESVVAIDPGKLKEPIRENVHHYAEKVEVCHKQVCTKHAPFDLLVCDMNIAPHLLLKVAFEPFTSSLNDGAIVILTVKNFTSGKTGKRLPFLQMVDLVAKDLARDCESVQLIHLMSNSENERTLVAKFSRQKSKDSCNHSSAVTEAFPSTVQQSM